MKQTIVPQFSIVTPVYNTPPAVLAETIDSVQSQSFQDWELVLIDDLSPDAITREVIQERAAADPRIRVICRESNGGIVAASNDGVQAARGEFIALLDHDDLLTSDALAEMAAAIDANPEVDYLYSDEDKVDADGHFFAEFRKPAWSPERLRHQMYTCHFSVLRAQLVREVGGFHDGFDGSQDHDLVLRVTERARQIIHIPKVLYHWRVIEGSTAGDADAKPYAWVAGVKAVNAHLDRTGLAAHADFGPHPGYYRIIRDPAALPSSSLIFPTRGGEGVVWGESRVFIVEAVRSALAKTSLRPEIVVVYDEPTPDGVLDELADICGDALTLVRYDKPFNFSEKCNLGVAASSGDIVVLMNDDLQAKSDGWLEELLGPLLEPDVGMTGAKLLYSDGTLQHAGHLYERQHIHVYRGEVPNAGIGFGAVIVNREVSGVTGAVAALRREVYDEVGGLFNGLPVNFNDVDLSYKVRHRGYRIVWMADSELYHFESQTREPVVLPWEVDLLHRRWGPPANDPFTRQ